MTYQAFPPLYPNSVSISSITVSDRGFAISNVQPSVPVSVVGNNQEVDIIVTVVAPSFSYSGNLNLVVTVSS